MRGTLAPSTGPTEGIRLANQAGVLLCSFPEVTQCTSQVGRPDDGTDTTGFFNTEYFVDLKPKEQWRPGVSPGQGRTDRRHEPRAGEDSRRRSGTSPSPSRTTWRRRSAASRASWPPRSTATTCRVLEDKADQIVEVMRQVRGHRGPGRVSRSRPAQRQLRGGPRAGRALSDQRRGRAGRHPDRRGRQRAHSGTARRSSATTW